MDLADLLSSIIDWILSLFTPRKYEYGCNCMRFEDAIKKVDSYSDKAVRTRLIEIRYCKNGRKIYVNYNNKTIAIHDIKQRYRQGFCVEDVRLRP